MKKIIAICSSVAFYHDVLIISKQLKTLGYKVLIPNTAKIMEKTGNFDENQHKTWYKNEQDYSIKKKFIDDHFKKIKKSDAILVVNNEKKGIKGYIGGNVLMEITLAYILKKPIFLWNPIDSTHPFEEEIKGVRCIFINKDTSLIQM